MVDKIFKMDDLCFNHHSDKKEGLNQEDEDFSMPYLKLNFFNVAHRLLYFHTNQISEFWYCKEIGIEVHSRLLVSNQN